jgi:hypothetical protein
MGAFDGRCTVPHGAQSAVTQEHRNAQTQEHPVRRGADKAWEARERLAATGLHGHQVNDRFANGRWRTV